MDKKLKKAAALTYEAGDDAPRVTALGKGEIANRIIETAKKNNVPIFEDSGLVDALLQLDIGGQIPQELYSVVAEVLVFVSKIDKLKGEKYGQQ
ncbi:MAG TPA: EscU/YscU/HrcU family type III secretion system export apparatus switch protein [Bacillota bacterium]|nr:EscU/YscU/HrcU family type III secretion system export apparatus switch protein [Clostridiaceae bacterium]HNR04831.1 EscU/YscU/HrcU family type III secretion system export apparatus switch protein [Bacillota bacterium]HNT03458.1 EscU/YscU/HrcU family type III secretion system export apparatus switch protein [Bacillota bacterium]HPA53587.1 EscU/YscU/HrcU family type III secretion system export apparatus switch protein [Bacillota bacterium]HPX68094.1 EscU/YscU/HrcU family type III secretion sy